jgi:hypothetical protein
MRRFERQAFLMGAMMERVQVDPTVSVGQGSAFAAASRRCLWCNSHEQCGRWLQEHAGAAASAPLFCPNADYFSVLRSRRAADLT